jgi:hypothetical protein
MYLLFPPKSLHTEKIDSRSYRGINLANAGARRKIAAR